MPSPNQIRISCQQVLEEDGSFYSVQWADLPKTPGKELDCREVAQRYYRLLRRANLSLVRVAESETGAVFELWPLGHALLRFEKAVPDADEKGDTVALKISGGSLVQSGYQNRGELLFRVEECAGRQRVTLQLSGFFPRLLGNPPPSPMRRRFYSLTMGAFHKFLSIRFIRSLVRDAMGQAAAWKLDRVVVRGGKDI